jgi:putative ABC transport system permease protein
MTWLRGLILRFRGLASKPTVERELDDEVHFHLDRQIEQNIAAGMSPEQARYRALQSFGGAEQMKEECRDARGTRFLEDFVQDFRFGLRMLRKSPGFAAVAVLTLALGIGANTAIFSVVNAVLLRPLPFKDADRLVAIWENNRKISDPRYPLAPANLADLRRESSAFDDVAHYFSFPLGFLLSADGETERLQGCAVSPNLFPMLGVSPAAGRTFLSGDAEPSQNPVAILSYGFWRRRFGGDPGILGRSVRLDSQSYTIVGVMPAGFAFPFKDSDVWVPATFAGTVFPQNQWTTRSVHYLVGIGRLKQGVRPEQAHAELGAIAQRLQQAYPESNASIGANLMTLQELEVGNVRPALLLLLAGVGFVLLIACANVANLLLARGATREKEFAVRAAMGARRSRLIRQLLTESMLTGLLGGLLGLLLAFAGVVALKALHPAGLPRMESVRIDTPVLLFALALSQLTGIVFGVIPARRQSHGNLNESLKEGGRSLSEGPRHKSLRGALVSLEIALSLVLLVATGLIARSFLRLQAVDPGFVSDRLLTLQIQVPLRYQDNAKRAAFLESIYGRIAALPGVKFVGDVTRLPFASNRRSTNITSALNIEGRPVSLGQRPEIDFRRASRGYFPAMGIPVLAGRNFTERDTLDTPRVAIINEALLNLAFRESDPVGQKIQLGPDPNGAWYTIVGVVGSIHHFDLDVAPHPEVYLASLQSPLVNPYIVARTTGDPSQLVSAVRSEFHSIDPETPVYNVATMEERLDESLAPRRFQVLLLALFAMMALTLATIGIYGLMAYSVSQRNHEIGVRMALGAQSGDVLRLVLGHGMRLALIGAGAGVIGALALTWLLRGLLFGVTPTDPLTFTSVVVFLLAVAFAACYIPARRATRMDPMIALRYE